MFTNLWKAIMIYIRSVCLFIHMELFCSHWTDFHEI